MSLEHIYKRFDDELNQINQHIIDMSQIVENQIIKAVNAFLSGDVADIDLTIKEDKRINKMEVQIDTQVVQLIVKRQPAAGDLRFLISVSKALADLERVGDEAKKMAKSARNLADIDRSVLPLSDIQAMSDFTLAMFRQSVKVFSTRDAAAAVDICYADIDVNAQYQTLTAQLIAIMQQKPESVLVALEGLAILKALERIGDHATNLAQYAIYQAYGKDVRHKKADKVRRRVEKCGGIEPLHPASAETEIQDAVIPAEPTEPATAQTDTDNT